MSRPEPVSRIQGRRTAATVRRIEAVEAEVTALETQLWQWRETITEQIDDLQSTLRANSDRMPDLVVVTLQGVVDALTETLENGADK